MNTKETETFWDFAELVMRKNKDRLNRLDAAKRSKEIGELGYHICHLFPGVKGLSDLWERKVKEWWEGM